MAADREIRALGVTFTVYDEGVGVDRPWPFDIIPRIIPRDQWQVIEAGLVQRLAALNLFIDDCLPRPAGRQRRRGAGRPRHRFPQFPARVRGRRPARGHLGPHLRQRPDPRRPRGPGYVLEDNLRVPSGVSYLLENRMVTKHIFPEMFRHYSIEPVDPYVGRLASMLASVSPASGDPTIVVLTPGIYNSAYFEHAFLAQQLGVELVEGSDLVVLDDDCVYARTIDGLERVDVIYRRVDDLFLDPEVFRPDSLLGVPGLMRSWRAGRVALVNAPGAGIADDKKVYSYVPDIIRFYLEEEPILWTIPTYRCSDPESRAHVLANLGRPGGQAGQRVRRLRRARGPQATAEELATAPSRSRTSPTAGWPSRSSSCRPRRPCATRSSPRATSTCARSPCSGPDGAYVTRGGLTRVARREGSLVVNSSQGGGSKDTWVVDTALSRRRPADHEGRRPRTPGAGTGGADVEGDRDPRPDAGDRDAETRPTEGRSARCCWHAWPRPSTGPGRYLERAEGTARIVQVHTDTHVDLPVGEDVGWEPLLAIAGRRLRVRRALPRRRTPTTPGRPRRTSSSSSSTARATPRRSWRRSTAARANLRTARPVVPREAWEAVNNLWLSSTDHLAEADSPRGPGPVAPAGHRRVPVDQRHPARHHEPRRGHVVPVLGQNLERADLTTRVLDVRSDNLHAQRGDDPYDVVHWMAVLRSLAAYQPFRRAMPARPQGGSTLRFLLQDDRFPGRSAPASPRRGAT